MEASFAIPALSWTRTAPFLPSSTLKYPSLSLHHPSSAPPPCSTILVAPFNWQCLIAQCWNALYGAFTRADTGNAALSYHWTGLQARARIDIHNHFHIMCPGECNMWSKLFRLSILFKLSILVSDSCDHSSRKCFFLGEFTIRKLWLNLWIFLVACFVFYTNPSSKLVSYPLKWTTRESKQSSILIHIQRCGEKEGGCLYNSVDPGWAIWQSYR